MDFERETGIVNIFLTFPWASRFRYMERKWWVLDEKGWTMLGARERASKALISTCQDAFPGDSGLQRQVRMEYIQKRLLARLTGHLHTYYLPGPGQDFTLEPIPDPVEPS